MFRQTERFSIELVCTLQRLIPFLKLTAEHRVSRLAMCLSLSSSATSLGKNECLSRRPHVRQVHSLSAGQTKRLSVGAKLLQNPKILILDGKECFSCF